MVTLESRKLEIMLNSLRLPALHLWSGWSLLRSMAPVASNMSLLKRVPLKWWGIVGYLCLLVLSATFPFFQSVERYSKDYPSLVPAFDFKNDQEKNKTRLFIENSLVIKYFLHLRGYF